jgi:hypothetical protein
VATATTTATAAAAAAAVEHAGQATGPALVEAQASTDTRRSDRPSGDQCRELAKAKFGCDITGHHDCHPGTRKRVDLNGCTKFFYDSDPNDDGCADVHRCSNDNSDDKGDRIDNNSCSNRGAASTPDCRSTGNGAAGCRT